jgi:hypothetical protein
MESPELQLHQHYTLVLGIIARKLTLFKITALSLLILWIIKIDFGLFTSCTQMEMAVEPQLSDETAAIALRPLF